MLLLLTFVVCSRLAYYARTHKRATVDAYTRRLRFIFVYDINKIVHSQY